MVESLVTTCWDAKTERPEVTRALYRSVAELDNEALIAGFASRVDAATAAMLASAADATFPDLAQVQLTLLSTIFGAVRHVFERDLAPADAHAVRAQLILMCTAYLERVKGQQSAAPDRAITGPGAPALIRSGTPAVRGGTRAGPSP
ncbi:hypothetical protein [Acidisoma sp. 7E03]